MHVSIYEWIFIVYSYYYYVNVKKDYVSILYNYNDRYIDISDPVTYMLQLFYKYVNHETAL